MLFHGFPSNVSSGPELHNVTTDSRIYPQSYDVSDTFRKNVNFYTTEQSYTRSSI